MDGLALQRPSHPRSLTHHHISPSLMRFPHCFSLADLDCLDVNGTRLAVLVDLHLVGDPLALFQRG